MFSEMAPIPVSVDPPPSRPHTSLCTPPVDARAAEAETEYQQLLRELRDPDHSAAAVIAAAPWSLSPHRVGPPHLTGRPPPAIAS